MDQNIVTRITEEEMQEVYNWVDEIPLSRPKKNIARDFSDCGKFTYFNLTFFDSSCCRGTQTLLTKPSRAAQLQ